MTITNRPEIMREGLHFSGNAHVVHSHVEVKLTTVQAAEKATNTNLHRQKATST